MVLKSRTRQQGGSASCSPGWRSEPAGRGAAALDRCRDRAPAACAFLELNGRTLDAPGDELYALVIAAATDELRVPQVATWMREHVAPLSPPTQRRVCPCPPLA